jgi:hypothetical protein
MPDFDSNSDQRRHCWFGFGPTAEVSDFRVNRPLSPRNSFIFGQPRLNAPEAARKMRLARRGGRAVECTGLENQQRLVAFRGFESHPLRQQNKIDPLTGPILLCLPSVLEVGIPVRPTQPCSGKLATQRRRRQSMPSLDDRGRALTDDFVGEQRFGSENQARRTSF